MLSGAQRLYHELYEAQARPRLYAAPWWLDAVCGKSGWDAVAAAIPEEGHVAMPYYVTRIRGLFAILNPPFTQWVDILSTAEKETSSFRTIYQLLPRPAILDLSLHPKIMVDASDTSISLSTRYSYCLPYANPAEEMISGYNEGLKRNLRAAAAAYRLEEKNDVDTLARLCLETYAHKKVKALQEIHAVLPSLARVLYQKHQGSILFVSDREGVIAAALFAWDAGQTYYVAGGRKPGEAGAAAHALLMHHAILQAQARNHDFDFEGSMIPGIANFFQSFGARPVPYTRIRQLTGWGKAWALFH